MASEMANWSELHHDLLVEIAGQIKLYEDFVSFRWVCTSWRSAATISNNFMNQFNRMPLLVHVPLNCSNNQFGFFSLSKGISSHVFLPKTNSRNCLSSVCILFQAFNFKFRTYLSAFSFNFGHIHWRCISEKFRPTLWLPSSGYLWKWKKTSTF